MLGRPFEKFTCSRLLRLGDLHLPAACPPAHELRALRCTLYVPSALCCVNLAHWSREILFPGHHHHHHHHQPPLAPATTEPRPLSLLRQLSCASACTPFCLHCVTSPGRAPSASRARPALRQAAAALCLATRRAESCAKAFRNAQNSCIRLPVPPSLCFIRRLRKAPDPPSSSPWISRSPSAKHLPLRPRWPSPMPSPSRTMRTTSELFLGSSKPHMESLISLHGPTSSIGRPAVHMYCIALHAC